jgi:hypothetical protein
VTGARHETVRLWWNRPSVRSRGPQETSSDHSISCSSRMFDTSTVKPSFFTVRESPDLTILGSRPMIAASRFGVLLFDGTGAF